MPSREAPSRQTRAGAESPSARLAQPNAANQTRLRAAYGQLPLSFEANQGQTNSRVQFLSRGKGYSLFLTSTEAVLALSRGTERREAKEAQARHEKATSTPGHPLPHPALRARHSALGTPHSALSTPDSAVLRMKLVGANSNPQMSGLEPLPGKVNYFLGKDPKQWRSNVPTYGKVQYQQVYPGIDLVYCGRQRQLEYDFVVAPGADPKSIRLSFEGVDRLAIDTEGNLVLHTAVGELVQHPPNLYQESHGTKQTISGRYVLLETESLALGTKHLSGTLQQVGFEVDRYNRRRPLVIDPIFAYSTYLGGSQADSGFGIAVDSAGSAYVTGVTESPDFPTKNPLQPFGGFEDAFVTKLNTAGTALVYSTYLGGSSSSSSNGGDEGHGIAVDSASSVYVTGWTASTNFPITPGAFQSTDGGGGCLRDQAECARQCFGLFHLPGWQRL